MKLEAQLVTTIAMNGREAASMFRITDAFSRRGQSTSQPVSAIQEGDAKVAADFAKLSGEATEMHERMADAKRDMNID